MFFLKSPFLENIQLDIVGFLAILGEASILANSQASFLLWASFLPRLIPAPQALIRTQRPRGLATEPAHVVGCSSGNVRDYVSHLAHIIHDADKVSNFCVKCIRIEKRKDSPELKAEIAQWGPLAWLAIVSCLVFIVLLVLSIHFDDGMALLADLLLGAVSVLTQAGSFYTLRLAPRTSNRAKLPPSDVIVNYPNGVFVYVQCDEGVARKLYWGPAECDYFFGDDAYRFISLIGTLILMGGVVALANSGSKMQLAFGATYVLLNAAYWFVAALPSSVHWNLSSFHVTESYTIDTGSFDKTGKLVGRNFTQALWTAIALTDTTDWVSITRIAPLNNPWRNWVEEAQAHLTTATELSPENGRTRKLVKPEWDCQEALSRYLSAFAAGRPDNADLGGTQSQNAEENVDVAAQDQVEDMNAETLSSMVLQPISRQGTGISHV